MSHERLRQIAESRFLGIHFQCNRGIELPIEDINALKALLEEYDALLEFKRRVELALANPEAAANYVIAERRVIDAAKRVVAQSRELLYDPKNIATLTVSYSGVYLVDAVDALAALEGKEKA